MSGYTRRITGAQAVINCLASLGINFAGVVSESADSNVVLMRFLATRAGQKLIEKHDWQFLGRDFTITTSPGVSTYAVPADFNKFKTDSSWNRTTRLPAIGSLLEPEWQMLKARLASGMTFTNLFRIADDMVEFYEAPDSAQTIVMPYVGRGWVLQADTNLSDNIELDSDIVLYDRQLFEAALRLEWDTEKKFDTTASTEVFRDLLAAAKAKDAPMRTLSLGQQPSHPYINSVNLPDSGYGS